MNTINLFDPNRKLQVRLENYYGKETYYPANTVGDLFAQIAGTKTLTLNTLKTAKALGFEIEVVAKAINLGVENGND